MNPKRKGSQFEREVCKRLSLWISDGAKQDVFWRSAMSGGRATIARGKVRQCGDIAPVATEGNVFCDKWFIEVKHTRDAVLDSFLVKGKGALIKYWRKATIEAKKYRRDPMLIFRRNGWPILVMTKTNHLSHVCQPIITGHGVHIYRFDDWMETRNNAY